VIKKVIKQTSWQILGKVVTVVATIITLGIITRTYGTDGTGVYTLVLTYLAFFYLAADLGLNAYVLPHVISDKSQANLLFNSRFYLSIFLVIIADLGALVMPFKTPQFIYSVFLGSLTIISIGIFNSANLIFQSSLRYDKSIIASSLGSLVTIPIVIYLSMSGAPIFYLMISPLFGLLINNLVIFFIIKSSYKFKLEKPNFNFLINTLKIAWPISLTLLLNTIYFRVDSFILATVRNFAEVGVYNLAYSVFQNVLVIPTFIMNGFYPIILQSLSQDKDKFLSQIKIAFLGMAGLSLLGILVTWIFSPLIIQILSKQGFEGSITSLRILSLSFPAFFISSLLMWVCLSLKEFKKMLIVYVLGLGINASLNIFLIPKYGFIAASWNTVISEYLILVLLITILYPNFKKLKG